MRFAIIGKGPLALVDLSNAQFSARRLNARQGLVSRNQTNRRWGIHQLGSLVTIESHDDPNPLGLAVRKRYQVTPAEAVSARLRRLSIRTLYGVLESWRN